MKPWSELTSEERKIAIAFRLGYPKCQIWAWSIGAILPMGYDNDGFPVVVEPSKLPDWPTNDGLAFTEVWPNLIKSDEFLILGTISGGPTVQRVCSIGCEIDLEPVSESDTWADVICRAAYELLPEEPLA